MTQTEETLSERVRALHARMAHLCLEYGKGIDTVRMVQIYAGMMSELLLEYELPGEMMASVMDEMGASLKIANEETELAIEDIVLPSVYVLDREIEFGRSFSREITFEEWDDVHEAIKILSNLIAHDFMVWEEQGLCRRESFALMHECLRLALAFEFAAQDLCDMLIEDRISSHGWTLSDCIIALSGIAGHQVSQATDYAPNQYVTPLEEIIFILTQEAVRLGVPMGRDWREMLAANDTGCLPPTALVEGAMPLCMKYAEFVQITHPMYISAMAAKAAGRMMAVASGGDFPEVEPVIAKPLAMLAVTESFRFPEHIAYVSQTR